MVGQALSAYICDAPALGSCHAYVTIEIHVAHTRLILDFLKRGRTVSYGPDRSQRADLHPPAGPPRAAAGYPVMVVIHGGSWTAHYGRMVMRGLVGDLVRRGWAVWNIEYRRVGNGGGWPATFADVAAAIDLLPELDAPLDLDRVSVLGHSAGGHLALWAAGRERLPAGVPGSLAGEPRVRLTRVIAQAGVCDLAGAYKRWRGGAVRALMGGAPDELPERYAVADPMDATPLSIPVLLVHGTLDETVSVELSRSYERAARVAGGNVELVEIPGEAGRHRAHIDPRGEAWAAVTTRLHVSPAVPLAP
jgi:acetyl esterase/lipase